MRFPYDGEKPAPGSPASAPAVPYSAFWKDFKGYLDINAPHTSARAITGPGSDGRIDLKTGPPAADFGKSAASHFTGPGSDMMPESNVFRGFSYQGRVWKLWAEDVSSADFTHSQYGTPSSFLTTATQQSKYNMDQGCPPVMTSDFCTRPPSGEGRCPDTRDYLETSRSVLLWNSVEGGSGQWEDIVGPGTQHERNEFPGYVPNATSICHNNQLPYGKYSPTLEGQLPGALQISGTLLCDRQVGVLYAKESNGGLAYLDPNDVGWVGYSFQCVDGTRPDRTDDKKFPVGQLPCGTPGTEASTSPLSRSSAPRTPLDTPTEAPIAASESLFGAGTDVAGLDTLTYSFNTQGDDAPIVEGGFIKMPTEVQCAGCGSTSPVWKSVGGGGGAGTPGPAARDVKIAVSPVLLVPLYPGYVPLIRPSSPGEVPASLPELPNCPPPAKKAPSDVKSITILTSGGSTFTIYYQYVRFMDQPAFRALWDEKYANDNSVDWAINNRDAPMTETQACDWQEIVETQLHQYVVDNSEWPAGWCAPSP